MHADLENVLDFTGKGIGVAVIDSGIADMAEFRDGWNSRIVFSASFVGGGAGDAYGHGTHVAGIIGSDDSGGVYVGMAPDTNLINLRARRQRERNGFERHPGHLHGDSSQEQVQHPRAEPFAGPACIRTRVPRSTVPRGGSRMEGRHRGRRIRWQRWTR